MVKLIRRTLVLDWYDFINPENQKSKVKVNGILTLNVERFNSNLQTLNVTLFFA